MKLPRDGVRMDKPVGNMGSGVQGNIARKLASQLYLAVWRWHFWAGLLVSPVLIALAITGAIIVFQPQLEPLIDKHLYYMKEGAQPQVPKQAFADAVAREMPGFYLVHFYAYPDPERTWDGFAYKKSDDGVESRRVFFDWHKGALIGQQDYNATFFREVIEIHRTLLAGLPGRIVTETATCWGIVSVLTGLYLWWPRKQEKVWGVWLPRIRGAARTVLKDWHTVPALYLSLILLVIMVTGLFFSHLWGTGYRAFAFFSGGVPEFYLSPPKSTIPAVVDTMPLSLDAVSDIASRRYNFEAENYEIALPAPGTDEPFSVVNANVLPWRNSAILYLDAYTGEELLFATGANLPWQSHLARLFYPLHTGLVFGLPTQILALLACIVLIATTSLGVLMWWRRRPAGTFGAPRQPPGGIAPKWMIAVTIALAIFLPTVGVSLILMAMGSFVCRRYIKS